jgi:uncharacterized membrane protein
MESRKATLKGHLQRKLLVGLVVFAPFALTAWILVKVGVYGYEQLTRPLFWLLDTATERQWSYLRQMIWDPAANDYLPYVKFALFCLSVVLTALMLYAIGFLSTTFFGKKFIQGIERLLHQVPGAEFLYNTFKQAMELLSRPRSKAFQRVVVIEYPRKGTLSLAFFTGVTFDTDSGDVLVYVFMPSTPNPTTGFLMFLKPEEVWDTDFTVAQASRFLLSFGIVQLDQIQLRPFAIAEYLEHAEAKNQTPTAPSGSSDSAGAAKTEPGAQGG